MLRFLSPDHPDAQCSALQVFDRNQDTIVEVRSDGSVLYAPNANVDRVAREFWVAVGRQIRGMTIEEHEDCIAELQYQLQIERYLSEAEAT